MKPLNLIIDGIRSFSERVEIDFVEVTKDGLFGIFGSTGSGKSTILDAVIISLYGRLPGIEMSELISARSTKAFTSLLFSISTGEGRKTYLVERSFTLKNDRSYRDSKASLFECGDGGNFLITSQTSSVNEKVEEILGLGLNEFTKCIVLPQGEFGSFISATKSERIRIVEKLFDLGRFGESFNAKLKRKISENQLEQAKLNATLEPLSDATEENVKNAAAEVANIENQIKEHGDKLLKIEEEISKNKKIYETRKMLFDVNFELEQKEKDEAAMLKLKNSVEIFPQAKSIVDKSVEIEGVADLLKKKERECAELCVERERRKEELDRAEREAEKANRDKSEIDGIRSKLSELDAMRPVYEQMRADEKEVGKYRSEYRELTKKSTELSEKKEKTEADIEKTEKRIVDLERVTDLVSVLNDVRNKTLRDEYDGQVKYYRKKIEELGYMKEASALYGMVDGEYRERLSMYIDKLAFLGDDADVKGVDEVVSDIRKYSDVLDKTRSELERKKREAAELDSKLSALGEKSSSLLHIGKIKADAVSSSRENISKIIGNDDNFDSFYETLKKRYERISDAIKKSESDFVSASERFGAADKKYAVAAASADEIRRTLGSTEKALSGLFSETIPTLKDARIIYDGVVSRPDAKSVSEEYFHALRSLRDKKSALEYQLEELGGRDFSENKYSDLLAERDDLKQKIEKFRENLGKNKKYASDLSQNFKKRCIIEKDIKINSKRRDVLSRMYDAVKDKRFSEFVAAEFLSDVAYSARPVLLELTDGKYDVVYSDGLDGRDGFFVLDNLNGGIKRSVASLSGGETFLVSLSLALSLSSEIYSRSSRPMEFFFLDEGFGTLDDGLVDSVLDSLFKLRNKHFTIGLISHLAEMKMRIESKINVAPAGEGRGSSVSIVL